MGDHVRARFRPPLPGAYLVVSTVLAGPYPGGRSVVDTHRRLERLLDAGCDRFVDLTEAGELEPYAEHLPPQTRHVRIGLRRATVPDSDAVRQAIDAVVAATRAGWLVYVHDQAGIGRVGALAGCLLSELGLSEGDALAQLARLRAGVIGPRSPLLESQRRMVRAWERRCATPSIRRLVADVRTAGGYVEGPGVFDPRRERDVRRLLVEALLLEGRMPGREAALEQQGS